jgi:predicted nuclease of restriction endonuclease-like (RecB) superfamily
LSSFYRPENKASFYTISQAKVRKSGMSENTSYTNWISDLKKRYRAIQIKAAVAVNSAVLEFYWSLGHDISLLYPGKKRKIRFFETLSKDLCLGIPNPSGLSPSNIKYSLFFYELYRNRQAMIEDETKVQSVFEDITGDLIRVPWGHHILIIDKSKGDRNKAIFYVHKVIENNWSRNDLQIAISENLYEKSGKAITNFNDALPSPSGYLAKELIKNEYSFALMETVDDNNEREIETALIRNITRTLTELGGGFAYVGHQVRVSVGGEDFWPDLIFYHLKSRRYLCIELKAGGFKPEHVGQLGFYMTAIDRQIKNEWDAPTIGLLLCRNGNRTVIEYALNITDKPMGVAKYKLVQKPPRDLSEINKAVSKLGLIVDETFEQIAKRM